MIVVVEVDLNSMKFKIQIKNDKLFSDCDINFKILYFFFLKLKFYDFQKFSLEITFLDWCL